MRLANSYNNVPVRHQREPVIEKKRLVALRSEVPWHLSIKMVKLPAWIAGMHWKRNEVAIAQ